jgi:hypothetical protein
MPVMGDKEAVMAEDQPNPFATPAATPAKDAQTPAAAPPATGAAPPADDEANDPPNADPAVKGVLAKERKAAREANARATAAEAKLQEIADKDKSATELLTRRAETAEREAATANAKVLRSEVAAEAGLTPALAARLQGSTKEELQADAKELQKLLGGGSTSRDPDQGRGDTSDPATGGGMSSWMRSASR